MCDSLRTYIHRFSGIMANLSSSNFYLISNQPYDARVLHALDIVCLEPQSHYAEGLLIHMG